MLGPCLCVLGEKTQGRRVATTSRPGPVRSSLPQGTARGSSKTIKNNLEDSLCLITA